MKKKVEKIKHYFMYTERRVGTSNYIYILYYKEKKFQTETREPLCTIDVGAYIRLCTVEYIP